MGKMKANRKFIEGDERAVSAVIGVILMVAITVAIAATVYVYVSGMLGGGATKAPDMAFNKQVTPNNRIMLVSATSGMQWDDFKITYSGVTGVMLNGATAWASGNAGPVVNVDAGNYINVTGLGTLSITHTATNTLMGTWTWV
jgi:flagellin-like protein